MNRIKYGIYKYIVPYVGKLMIKKNTYINVIYYHDIVKDSGSGAQHTNIDIFKKQMEYIKENGYKTYTFDDLSVEGNMKFNDKSILITFDDGWKSNYTYIFEYMKEKNIKYNVFLTAGMIGQCDEYLSWEMIRKMYNSKLVGFGAHTYHHVAMNSLQTVNVVQEIEMTNKVIEKEIGTKIVDFCYPFGKYSAESLKYLERHTDYVRIYTSDLMYSYKENNKIIFGRSSINNDEPFSIFINKLEGNYNCYNMIRGC